jgi:hypothetical protein
MTLQPGVAPVNFAQTVRSVSWTLNSVFGVVQSLANVATVGDATGGIRKLKFRNTTVSGEETVELSLLCVIRLLSLGVVGEEADPIKSGMAKSAPTTMKTAIIR